MSTCRQPSLIPVCFPAVFVSECSFLLLSYSIDREQTGKGHTAEAVFRLCLSWQSRVEREFLREMEVR